MSQRKSFCSWPDATSKDIILTQHERWRHNPSRVPLDERWTSFLRDFLLWQENCICIYLNIEEPPNGFKKIGKSKWLNVISIFLRHDV